MKAVQDVIFPGVAVIDVSPKKSVVIRLRWPLVLFSSYLLVYSEAPALDITKLHALILFYIFTNATLYFVDEEIFDHFELIKSGSMTSAEYDSAMRDLTNFMVYMGEPAKLERPRLGIYVLLFLAVFFVVAYMLKKEYWKDVH